MISRGSSRGSASCAVLLLCAWPFMAHADDWGGSLGAVSDNVFRGVTQSDGEASAQADVHYTLDFAPGTGFAGVWATATGQEHDDRRAAAELNVYLGFAWSPAPAWQARLAAVHYRYPLDPSRRHDYDELSATTSWRNRLFATVAVSPDKSAGRVRHEPAYVYELAAQWPFTARASARVGSGYYDLRRQLGTGYAYWNLTLSYALRASTFELAYIGADDQADAIYADRAGDRLVGSVNLRF